MDDDVKQTLKKVLELTAENNRILRSMRREILITRVVHIIYWIIIIAILVAGYYYFQPYIQRIMDALQALDRIRLPR